MSLKDLFGAGKTEMPWKELSGSDQIAAIVAASNQKPQLIFKHSTRCSISLMAKKRFEREWNLDGKVEPWYLDLLEFRPISNAVADQLNVIHQSPQAILLVNGNVVYEATHSGISVDDIGKVLP